MPKMQINRYKRGFDEKIFAACFNRSRGCFRHFILEEDSGNFISHFHPSLPGQRLWADQYYGEEACKGQLFAAHTRIELCNPDHHTTRTINYISESSIDLVCHGASGRSILQDTWVKFNIVDYISTFIRLIGGTLALPWMQTRGNSENEAEAGKGRKLAPILRGIALSLPVWLIFIALLYSADMIYAERINNILAGFNINNLVELVVQLILALVMAYFFAGVVLFAAQRSDQTVQSSGGKPLVSPFLGLTETGIILGGIILLFGSFVIVQFQYFFSGQANISLAGFTYAEYARKGFGELVGVAVEHSSAQGVEHFH